MDVVNGPRPVIISITTDTSAWEWLVRAGEKRTLLDETGARPGGIEVISDVEVTGACTVLARATFSASSFTIVLSGRADAGAYDVMVQPGASLTGPARTDYFPGCTG